MAFLLKRWQILSRQVHAALRLDEGKKKALVSVVRDLKPPTSRSAIGTDAVKISSPRIIVTLYQCSD